MAEQVHPQRRHAARARKPGVQLAARGKHVVHRRARDRDLAGAGIEHHQPPIEGSTARTRRSYSGAAASGPASPTLTTLPLCLDAAHVHLERAAAEARANRWNPSRTAGRLRRAAGVIGARAGSLRAAADGDRRAHRCSSGGRIVA
jgi:hypothetical protein